MKGIFTVNVIFNQGGNEMDSKQFIDQYTAFTKEYAAITEKYKAEMKEKQCVIVKEFVEHLLRSQSWRLEPRMEDELWLTFILEIEMNIEASIVLGDSVGTYVWIKDKRIRISCSHKSYIRIIDYYNTNVVVDHRLKDTKNLFDKCNSLEE